MTAARRASWRGGAAALAIGLVAAATAAPAPGATADATALTGDGLLARFALTAGRGPVTISSESLEFEYRTGVLTYRGKVEVKQGDVVLRSDLLRLTLNLEDLSHPREIVAEGNVRISKGERVATGGRAVFDQGAQTITLSKAAVLRDGPNEVSGERVVVYLEEERSVVEGGDTRVRAKLFPPSSGDDDAALPGGTHEP